jgi:hypothetical protein
MAHCNMKIIKAPESLPFQRVNGVVPSSVFLAGSIEMGAVEDWQTRLTNIFDSSNRFDYIFNPRRESWDSSWEQSINNPQFNEQVSWEMTALDIAETIILYLHPETKAPISLLELGLYANTGKVIVCCPDGFWRKGNVEMVCHRHNITLFNGSPTEELFLPILYKHASRNTRRI